MDRLKIYTKAFTLAEILLVMFIIGVIASAVIPITNARINGVANSAMTYSTLDALKTAVAEYKQLNSSADFSKSDTICSALSDNINTVGKVDCSKTYTTKPTKGDTPTMIFANGVKIFLGSYDSTKKWFNVYVDIDGNRRSTTLNDDLIEFIVTDKVAVMPAPSSIAATSVAYLSTSYEYYKDKKWNYVSQNVSYKDGICGSGTIKNASYCGSDDALVATCKTNDCEFNVNRPAMLK